jgi:glycosyltransferase involved in cell wall biosynthesis
MKIAIVLPAYNEEKSIGRVIDGIKSVMIGSRYGFSIIVVNDCSTDKTAAIVRQKKVTLVNHVFNKGYGGALITGFKYAQDSDVIVTLDSDGQHDPKEILSLIRPIVDCKADVVIGSRFLNRKTQFPLYRKFGIFIFTKVTNIMFGLNVSDCQSGLRAYRGLVLRKIRLDNKDMGISLEIIVKLAKRGYRIAEVPSVCDYSKAHYSKNPVSHGINLLKSLLKCYFEK